MVLDVIHPARPNVSKAELSEKLSEMYKTPKEQCIVFGMRTAFGGGRSTGFALIYDSRDSMKFEPKHRLVRVSIGQTSTTDGLVGASIKASLDPRWASRIQYLISTLTLASFVSDTIRLASPRRPRRHRASCARSARTVPRRSVVPRRPRPATLPRRSKRAILPPSFASLGPHTAVAAVLFSLSTDSRVVGGSHIQHSPSSVATMLSTSFRPFFRSQQRCFAAGGPNARMFRRSPLEKLLFLPPKNLTLHRHLFISYDCNCTINPPRFFCLLVAVDETLPPKTHTHPEISKEGGVVLQHDKLCCFRTLCLGWAVFEVEVVRLLERPCLALGAAKRHNDRWTSSLVITPRKTGKMQPSHINEQIPLRTRPQISSRCCQGLIG